jgi:hypothetical protein
MRRSGVAICALVLLGTLGCTQSVAGTPSAGTALAAPASSQPAESAQPGAVIAGWQPVSSAKRNAVFDAPPGWTLQPDSIVVGFESGGAIVAGSGSGSFRHGFCPSHPGAERALAVLTSSGIADLSAAATDAARRWGELAYQDDAKRRPELTPEAPVPLRTSSGLNGMAAKVVARPASVGPCGSPSGLVRVLAASIKPSDAGRGATVVLVVVADTDVPDAAPAADLEQILTTLRPIA